MATPESHRPDESGSNPAPPELPERGPERFQFSLLHLLAFMFVSALLAFGSRHVVLYVGSLPPTELLSIQNVVMGAVAFGGLLYFFLRVPYIGVRTLSFRRRWQEIQQHRRELEAWRKDRVQSRREQEVSDKPPPE